MPAQDKVSAPGVYCFCVLCFVCTIGQEFTTGRAIYNYNWLWLTGYALAIFILAGAAVNFNMKRWLR